ncbi:DUF2948 family protein [Agrobacterium rubi]|uniref:DUF2948 family protein n=1 Tax=Agrobacterium rubi TaxID=28099 RepID=A0AAE7RB46_9HYPH|nr:DUF2948 family protein [Agrobacterium rubi]NTE85407.1 DUF2948 family protein [Agrobacterium rubi]NTF01339.1 DUF2948 family protein [Agrobacterium rubi]NTF06463.1 DUF2948 family protein [Agrobacterium rubi]NTF18705.1 DUF2948 family protein [Agrobacterium rubi]NTF25668.1 DUF2948 family protein [Agrobacterium rubi]
MSGLKLMALDGEDLSIISTHMQDSVFKLKDASFDRKHGQFLLSANRFVWENGSKKSQPKERCRSVFALKRVGTVRSYGFDRDNKEQVLSLLAVQFKQNGEGPDGTVELTLSGGGAIALDVECIEAQLADVSGGWETASKPHHPED